MPLFSVLNYGHIDIHDEPSSLFFSFLYFSMSSVILSSRVHVHVRVLGDSSHVVILEAKDDNLSYFCFSTTIPIMHATPLN